MNRCTNDENYENFDILFQLWPDVVTHLKDSVVTTNNSEILREASLEVEFLNSFFF